MKTYGLQKVGIFLTATALIVVPHYLAFSFYNKEAVSELTVAPPTFLASSPRDEAVFLQWTNTTTALDHIVEYKESEVNNWNIFEHPTSSAPGITVTDLINGTSYDFRISTISSEGQSMPTIITNVAPIHGAIQIFNNQIISTGQSLALGAFAFPYLSTTQPYDNKMLNSGRSALIPLSEPMTGTIDWASGETMSSALANMVTFLAYPTIPNYTSIVSLSAEPGVPYTSLKQGTTVFNNSLANVTAAKDLSLIENKTLIVPAITVIHGETDQANGTSASQYEINLVEWQNDYQNDIKAITGQREPVLLFTDQMSSWNVFGSAVPEVALGQYNAAKNNPGSIIIVTPKYIFDSIDWMSHMTNYSQRRLGEYYAKVYKKIVIDGEEWKPLMPESVNLYSNIIQAEFHVPVGPLAFDTTAVMFKENYGFEYTDSANSAYITNVEIVESDTVEITLSGVPTGTNPRLRYAYSGAIGSWAGRNIAGAPRGNLRDSDMTQAFSQDASTPASMGSYLHNWALTFDEPITESGQLLPDQPTLISAGVGTAIRTAIVSFIPPVNTGLGEITNYIVTSNPGNLISIGTASPIHVTGLSYNTNYTFTVMAQNSAGVSSPSTSSNVVNLGHAYMRPNLEFVSPRRSTTQKDNIFFTKQVNSDEKKILETDKVFFLNEEKNLPKNKTINQESQ